MGLNSTKDHWPVKRHNSVTIGKLKLNTADDVIQMGMFSRKMKSWSFHLIEHGDKHWHPIREFKRDQVSLNQGSENLQKLED